MGHQGDATTVEQMVPEPQKDAVAHETQLLYSAKVIELALDPKNQGRMVEPDAYGVIHGCCGDTMEIYLRLDDDRITQATFMTDGLEPALACGSMLTTMVQGLSPDEAGEIGPRELIVALDSLPRAKMHCASLTVNALQQALAEWFTDGASQGEAQFDW